MWIDPSLESEMGECKLNSTLKKKKAQAGNDLSNSMWCAKLTVIKNHFNKMQGTVEIPKASKQASNHS